MDVQGCGHGCGHGCAGAWAWARAWICRGAGMGAGMGVDPQGPLGSCPRESWSSAHRQAPPPSCPLLSKSTHSGQARVQGPGVPLWPALLCHGLCLPPQETPDAIPPLPLPELPLLTLTGPGPRKPIHVPLPRPVPRQQPGRSQPGRSRPGHRASCAKARGAGKEGKGSLRRERRGPSFHKWPVGTERLSYSPSPGSQTRAWSRRCECLHRHHHSCCMDEEWQRVCPVCRPGLCHPLSSPRLHCHPSRS